MVKFVEEKLNMDSPAVLAALNIRAALGLQGNEVKQVSEIIQVARKILRRSVNSTAVTETAAAIIDKFNGAGREKQVLHILQSNADVFRNA